jgi:hypothetical protein
MKKIVQFIGVFILGLVIIEAYLQLTNIVSPMDTTLVGDSQERYFMKNKVSFTFKESFGILKSDGKNTLTFGKKDGKPLSFFGTSMTVASEVFPRQHFANLIGEEKGFSIRNFAVHGMDIYSIFGRYIQVKDQIDPKNTYVFISAERFPDTKYEAFFSVPEWENGKMTLVDQGSKASSQGKVKVYPLMQNSSILTLSNRVRSIISRGMAPSILLDKFYFDFSSKNQKTGVYKEPLVNKSDILRMLNTLKKDGVKLVFLGNIEVASLSKQQLNFAKSCLEMVKESGIEYFDFYSVLPQDIEERKAFYRHPVTKDYGHFNKQGHQFFAEKIKDFIQYSE